MTETLSIQLYSGRNFPPLADQIRIVAESGYRAVEPFRGLYDDVAGLKRLLDEHGLKSPSGHYSMDLLEGDYAKAVEVAKAIGNEIVVLPYLGVEDRPKDAEGWKGVGRRVGSIAKRLKGDGLRCAWHNHDFEMVPLDDGSRPIQHILDSDMEIEWEADVAWIVRGGEDPAVWLERYKGRIPAIHVKDIARQGEKTDEDGWADVGDGRLDWEKLWQAARAAGSSLMIAEHDNPSDFRRFATRSLKAMQSYAGSN